MSSAGFASLKRFNHPSILGKGIWRKCKVHMPHSAPCCLDVLLVAAKLVVSLLDALQTVVLVLWSGRPGLKV